MSNPLVTPLDITCRHWEGDPVKGSPCLASPGENCKWLVGGEFHAERIEDAASMNEGSNPIHTDVQIKNWVDKRLF